MKATKLPSLVLAVALQVLPISRVFIASTPAAGSSFAIISTWIAGAFALLGSYNAVSGASSISITPASATNGVRYSGIVQYSGGHASDAKSWQLRNNWIGAQSGCNTVYQIAPGLWLTNTSTYLARVGGTPTASGTYSFTLRIHSGINCGGGDNDTRTASITIYAGANSPPVANAQSVTNAEDTAKPITLTGSDPNGNPITYSIVSQPTHGTLNGTAPNVIYMPATNYSGSDSFTFKVNDGIVDSPAATVSLNVTPINDPPVANSQSVTNAEDTAKPITLTGSDPDGNPLTYAIVSQPTHGTLSGAAPNVTYMPATNYSGSDSFTFKVNDVTVDSLPATVSLIVTPVNDPPVANSQSVTNAEDTAKAITLTGSDPDGNPLTYAIVSQPTHGTLSGSAPNVTYMPATNYSGSDSFTFKVNDSNVDSVSATVSITITPVTPPTSPTLGRPTFGPGGLTLTATGSPGQSWAVERATQLGIGSSWTNIGTLLIAPNGTGQYQDPNPPSGRAFFRLVPP